MYSGAAPEPQILLILVGLPGSGKSTFSEALVHHSVSPTWAILPDLSPDHPLSMPPRKRRRWLRASQDDSPSGRRQECEAIVRQGLYQGHNVIVDRVGFNKAQRNYFVTIADQISPQPLVYSLHMSVSVPTLETRLLARPFHPTIKDPETAMRVLHEMTRAFQPTTPGGGEGFDRLFTLEEQGQPIGGMWTAVDVAGLLDRVEREGKPEVEPRTGAFSGQDGGRAHTGYLRGRGFRARGFDAYRGGGQQGLRGGYQGYHGYQGVPQQIRPVDGAGGYRGQGSEITAWMRGRDF